MDCKGILNLLLHTFCCSPMLHLLFTPLQSQVHLELSSFSSFPIHYIKCSKLSLHLPIMMTSDFHYIHCCVHFSLSTLLFSQWYLLQFTTTLIYLNSGVPHCLLFPIFLFLFGILHQVFSLYPRFPNSQFWTFFFFSPLPVQISASQNVV